MKKRKTFKKKNSFSISIWQFYNYKIIIQIIIIRVEIVKKKKLILLKKKAKHRISWIYKLRFDSFSFDFFFEKILWKMFLQIHSNSTLYCQRKINFFFFLFCLFLCSNFPIKLNDHRRRRRLRLRVFDLQNWQNFLNFFFFAKFILVLVGGEFSWFQIFFFFFSFFGIDSFHSLSCQSMSERKGVT